MSAAPEPRASLPVPVPAYGGGCIADVLPAVLRSLKVEPRSAGRVDGLPLATSRQVCVLLVDGLGWSALRGHPDRAPFLGSLVDEPRSRPITSVFPTTTPIALTSLGTGLPPGEHGVTGLFVRLASGQVVNTLANPAETDMAALQPRATAFERAASAGVAVTRVGPRAFDGRGLTEAALRGGDYAAAETLSDRVTAAAHAVGRAATSLTYVYVGDLDATGHRSGCRSEAWRAQLARLDAFAEQLAGALPGSATLLVTSDHGMVDVPFENRWDLATAPGLDAGVEVLAGDLRGVYVHTRPGAAEDVRAAWRETLGADFWVLARDEAVEAGLYGPVVTPEARGRIGDVVAVATGHGAVVDSRVHPPEVLSLVGLHGSVTEDELVVPLLVHGG